MHAAAIAQLEAALQGARDGRLGAAALAQQWRGQVDLLAALPPRFAEVLLPLLDSLESSALFTEESCSFSQRDLLDALATWLAKARLRLA